nr:hypothetical protein [Tanacetum cinerariifolium]
MMKTGFLDSGGGGEKKKKKKGVGSAVEPNDSGNTNAHSSTPNAMLNTPISGLVDPHKSTGGPNFTTPIPYVKQVCNEPGMIDIPSSSTNKLKTKANLRKLEVHVPNDADYDVWLPLSSVHEIDYPDNLGSNNEVEPVDNEIASYLISKLIGVGYGPKRLSEQ